MGRWGLASRRDSWKHPGGGQERRAGGFRQMRGERAMSEANPETAARTIVGLGLTEGVGTRLAADFALVQPPAAIDPATRVIFVFQAEDGIRDKLVNGVQTC